MAAYKQHVQMQVQNEQVQKEPTNKLMREISSPLSEMTHSSVCMALSSNYIHYILSRKYIPHIQIAPSHPNTQAQQRQRL